MAVLHADYQVEVNKPQEGKSRTGGKINSEGSSYLSDLVSWICQYLRAHSIGHPQCPGIGDLGSHDYVRVRQKRRR